MYSSANSKATWETTQVIADALSLYTINASTGSAQRVYANGNGFFMSDDAGASWKTQNAGFLSTSETLVFTEEPDVVVTVNTDNALVMSVDAGENWWEIGPITGTVMKMAFEDDTHDTFIAASDFLGLVRYEFSWSSLAWDASASANTVAPGGSATIATAIISGDGDGAVGIDVTVEFPAGISPGAVTLAGIDCDTTTSTAACHLPGLAPSNRAMLNVGIQAADDATPGDVELSLTATSLHGGSASGSASVKISSPSPSDDDGSGSDGGDNDDSNSAGGGGGATGAMLFLLVGLGIARRRSAISGIR